MGGDGQRGGLFAFRTPAGATASFLSVAARYIRECILQISWEIFVFFRSSVTACTQTVDLRYVLNFSCSLPFRYPPRLPCLV